jgi:hypothetical protein
MLTLVSEHYQNVLFSEIFVGMQDIDCGLSSHWTAWPYYPFLAAASAHLAWQISTVDLSDRLDCNRK